MKTFTDLLYQFGLLHDEQTKSERVASFTTSGSILILIALIPLVVVDDFLLNKSLHDYLAIVGKIALGGFGLGCILIILATNKII